MVKAIALICITVAVTACSSVVGTTNIQPTAVETSRVINVGYDETWLRVVDWFAKHNILIGKSEKESGFINAEYTLPGVDLSDLSCGEPTGHMWTAASKFEDAFGLINVTVRKVDKEKTRVIVNFSGRVSVVIRDVWGGVIRSTTARCYSKGTIEKSVLDSIQKS